MQPHLIPIAIVARMTHGHSDEAAQIINTLKTVSLSISQYRNFSIPFQLMYRWEFPLCSDVGQMFVSIMKSLSRRLGRELLCCIAEAHASSIRDAIRCESSSAFLPGSDSLSLQLQQEK